MAEVSIKVTRKNFGVITYQKYEKNAEVYRKYVRLTLMDRIKKVSFEQKAHSVFQNLKSRLIEENIQIRENKRIQEEVNSL